VIYPGALIMGETVATGEYIPIVADRAPFTLSISLENIGGSPKATVQNPSLSNVRAAINQILKSNVTGATPAKISFEMEEVHSSEQLKIAIGANYSNAFVKVSGSFDFNKEEIRSRVVVKFLQIYYSLDIDTPAKPSDFFNTPPKISSLGSTSPMYISTMTYGRMVLFTAESSKSSTEIKAALHAAFNAGVHDGSIDISTEYKKIIEQSSIKALVLGGSGDSGTKVVSGIEGLKEYIQDGGNYNKDSPGAPLSYKMRYLKDNSVGKVVLSTEYAIRQCELNYPQYRIEIKSIKCRSCEDGNGSNGEVFGNLYADINYGDELVDNIAWNSGGNISMSNGSFHNINLAKIIDLYKPDFELDNIKIGGYIAEDDYGCPWDCDDIYGTRSSTIYLKEINFEETEYELNFSNAVIAYFIINRLK
jgi:thiol-activated cytolysin